MNADQRIEMLREYGENLNVFVETGTADGYTTLSLEDDFERLITVEIDYDRYLHVLVTQFMTRPKIQPIWGDSAKVLQEVSYWVGEPALYWLDAHYSGGARGSVDTPIVEELRALQVNAPKGSVILVDDARLFGFDPAYPALSWVEAWAANRFEFEVKDDVIRLVPKESA